MATSTTRSGISGTSDSNATAALLATLRFRGALGVVLAALVSAVVSWLCLGTSGPTVGGAVALAVAASAAVLLIRWMTGPLHRLHQLTLGQDKALESQVTMVGQLQAILENASIGILFTRDQRFELVGRHFCQALGFEEADLLGQSVRLIYPSDEAYAVLGQRVREAFVARGYFDGELLLQCKDGTLIWTQMLGRGVVPNDPSGGTIWIVEDITQERAAREDLSWAATHDSLTHLPNRREFELRLSEALKHMDGGQVCVMYLDLDRFKVINDTAGHAAGDVALCQVARLLEHEIRQSDTAARLGGDEFAVLLPGCSLQRASVIAEAMRGAVAHWQMTHEGHTFTLGVSIGIAETSAQLQLMADVLHAADSACYEAKRHGRNRVELHRVQGAAQAVAPPA